VGGYNAKWFICSACSLSCSHRWSSDEEILNGRNHKTPYSSGIASMFLRMQTSTAGLLTNTTIPTLPDMQVGGKQWNWYPATTGGHKGPATLASIAKPVTSASGQRRRNNPQWVNSNRFQSQRDVGMWQM
jgi:hypothetical protein